MIFRRRPPDSPIAAAAAAGGAVTRDRLRAAAARESMDGAPIVRSLLAQSLPSDADLVDLYRAPFRLDPSLLDVPPEASRLLDPDALRTLRCAPLALFADLVVLAVAEPGALKSVEYVRSALRRDVLPVAVPPDRVEALLLALPDPPDARRAPEFPRRAPHVKTRFRRLAEERDPLDAIPVPRGSGA